MGRSCRKENVLRPRYRMRVDPRHSRTCSGFAVSLVAPTRHDARTVRRHDADHGHFPMRALQAGFAYFGVVFGAGFVLGSIRVPFLVPRLGERWAELVEMPVMAVVIVLAARWIVRRFSLTPRDCWITGLIALLSTLAAELLLAVVIAGRSVGAYLASRDPVSGSVYVALLLVFAAMPCLLVRRWATGGAR